MFPQCPSQQQTKCSDISIVVIAVVDLAAHQAPSHHRHVLSFAPSTASPFWLSFRFFFHSMAFYDPCLQGHHHQHENRQTHRRRSQVASPARLHHLIHCAAVLGLAAPTSRTGRVTMYAASISVPTDAVRRTILMAASPHAARTQTAAAISNAMLLVVANASAARATSFKQVVPSPRRGLIWLETAQALTVPPHARRFSRPIFSAPTEETTEMLAPFPTHIMASWNGGGSSLPTNPASRKL